MLFIFLPQSSAHSNAVDTRRQAMGNSGGKVSKSYINNIGDIEAPLAEPTVHQDFRRSPQLKQTKI